MLHPGQKQKLSDICEFIIDCEHKTAPTQVTGYPSIRTPNIGRGRLILDDVNRVSEETYKDWTRRAEPKGGDLILAREAPVGNVAMIPKNIKVCLGQRTVLMRPDNTKIEGSYLLYLLLGDEIQAKFHSQTAGATVAHLNLGDIRKVEIPHLPSREVQQKIAAILSAYDDLVENNLRRIRILEEMAQVVYRKWFVKFRFPSHQKVKMVDSLLGKIPEGWRVSGILDCNYFEFIDQSIRPYDGTKLYYATADVSGIQLVGEGTKYTYEEKPDRAQKEPEVNSVWFARMQETYKVLSFTDTNKSLSQNCMLSSGFVGFRSSGDLTFPFLLYTINSEDFHRHKDQFCTGATQRAITNERLRRIQIVVPPVELVEQFGEGFKESIDYILILLQKNKIIRKTRDLLLPKLISGELDVSELDITIPEADA
jgi:type I restriction enzyme S subunit